MGVAWEEHASGMGGGRILRGPSGKVHAVQRLWARAVGGPIPTDWGPPPPSYRDLQHGGPAQAYLIESQKCSRNPVHSAHDSPAALLIRDCAPVPRRAPEIGDGK